MLLPVKVESKQGLISWNFAELKKELGVQLKKFDDLIVTEDEISDFEGIRANLNKVSRLIDNERKRIKAEYTEPLSIFEKEVKELTGMINDVNSKIDIQLKDFEETRKFNKQQEIYLFAEELANESGLSFINFDLLFDSKWLNKTVSDKKWKNEVADKYVKVSEDLEIIKSMNSDEENMLINLYIKHNSLNIALQAHREFKQLQQANIPTEQEKPNTEPETNSQGYVVDIQQEVLEEVAETSSDNSIYYYYDLSIMMNDDQRARLESYLYHEGNAMDWILVKSNKGENK